LLGAAVTCAEVQEHGEIARHFPALCDAAGLVGGVAVQNRATVGGNLCNAAPSADTIPVLVVSGAMAHLKSASGERQLAVSDVCTGPGQTALEPGELLTHLQLPPPGENTGAAYLRSTPRHEMDIAVAGAGCWLRLEGDRILEARIALSAVAPVPLVAASASDSLAGKPASNSAIEEAANLAADEARPISDVRGSSGLRRELVRVLVRRVITQSIQRARS
jgi:carbon-monoxide dehydrogenase medium subunit